MCAVHACFSACAGKLANVLRICVRGVSEHSMTDVLLCMHACLDLA